MWKADADKDHICPQRWEPKTADKPAFEREKSFRALAAMAKTVESLSDKRVNIMFLETCILLQVTCGCGLEDEIHGYKLGGY